jgi:hypothetical protein
MTERHRQTYRSILTPAENYLLSLTDTGGQSRFAGWLVWVDAVEKRF